MNDILKIFKHDQEIAEKDSKKILEDEVAIRVIIDYII